MPFETLDTTSRCLSRYGGDVIVSDTVGFIRRLPERLIASFETTLAEICESSLIVIVVDVSDYEWQDHLAITTGILEKLKCHEIPRFYVFNKVDRLDQEMNATFLTEICGGCAHAVLSSKDKDAVNKLKSNLLKEVRDEQIVEFFVPYTASSTLKKIYSGCRIIQCETMDNGMCFRVQSARHVIAKIAHSLKEQC